MHSPDMLMALQAVVVARQRDQIITEEYFKVWLDPAVRLMKADGVRDLTDS